MRVGIIGATGWLGSALGGRLLSLGILEAKQLTVLNRSGPRPDYHGHNVHWAADVDELATASDVIVVSVRPHDWSSLNLKADGKLVVSFMAGVGADDLGASGGRIMRVMPNAAAEIGESYSPYWAGPGVTAQDRDTVAHLLSAIGTSDELPDEAQIDLMTAVPGSGAAYPALMAMAMFGFLRDRGVPDQIAWRATEAAICGGAAMLTGQIENAAVLLAAYRDYRGTTAAGIEAAEMAGFSATISRALEAATEKARQMGPVLRP